MDFIEGGLYFSGV